MNAPLTAVVVLNFNGWRDTIACVRSVLDDSSAAARVVVVCDNASADGSFEHLGQAFAQWPEGARLRCMDRAEAEQGDAAWDWGRPGLVLIRNGGNLGFAGGCNVGVRWALGSGASHVWLLNNDTEVAPGALDALLARMAASPDIGLCGSRLVYHGARHLIQARGGAVYQAGQGLASHIGVHEPVSCPEDPAEVERRMDYVVGASMMASREMIERVGLMREDYFLYYEELDWALRARSRGFGLGYAPGSVVFHKEGATIGSSHREGGASALSLRYLSRNRLLLTRRFFPQCLGSVRRRMLFEILVFCKRGQWQPAGILLRALWRDTKG